MTKALGLACLILVAYCVEATARCSMPTVRTLENQTVDGRMWADSGKPCRIRFISSSGPMFSIEIVQRPTNGTLQLAENHNLIYTSRRGFVGSDSFIYARRGESRGGAPVTRTVRVAVTVSP